MFISYHAEGGSQLVNQRGHVVRVTNCASFPPRAREDGDFFKPDAGKSQENRHVGSKSGWFHKKTKIIAMI